ncbi:uncharacterized protein CTRU02_200466 [Colletotrichum truncatum]|uniref:Uncharacterized protein n=1 Tax=Colletotrichum truncatum TaxID=5467 RepID=A0ACC3ZEN1_COLTU|nr:uncharacterized protein CTRU02_00226 [Colletotrichum truncatum]KAF6801477.1 hypothetical protein CTRU02_00226 [Colletotrichum truncatum]
MTAAIRDADRSTLASLSNPVFHSLREAAPVCNSNSIHSPISL